MRADLCTPSCGRPLKLFLGCFFCRLTSSAGGRYGLGVPSAAATFEKTLAI